ncbi:MAG: phytoene desaturase family protein [Chloroflexi bacterium]|nr:phytoene desaturase family protein [Chloroflexota bacterium]
MQNSSSTLPIIIIGAGIGGLSAAIRLASAGRRVLMLEQNPQVGGKMSQFCAAGFRWDTGPSVITMRHVFAELFAAAGRHIEDYLTLIPVEPLTRYFYQDGTVLDASRNWPTMAAQIEHIEPRDIEGYLRFLAYAARLHRITGPAFIYDQPPSLRSLARVPPWDVLKIDPWLTLNQVIQRHVRSPHLRQLLQRFATYVGADPFQAPATLGVIAHVELTGGVWYPQGGIYAIAIALARLATELGVEIRTNCPVQQIVVKNSQATGVRLTDGRTLDASTVIANVDVTTVYQQLLPPEIATTPRRQQLTARETSCSGYVMLLGIEGDHPRLAHHNIFFASDYQREFTDIFQQGIPPNDPTIYVAITSKSDPDHAPPGCENWFVLVNAPAVGANFDWATQEADYRQRIFATLKRFGFDLQPRLRSQTILTPVDLAERTGAWRGALYGISSNQALNAFRRPHNRSAHVRRLYFVGGTTHPGGGVPMVTLSGKVVAEMVLADSKVMLPAPNAPP